MTDSAEAPTEKQPDVPDPALTPEELEVTTPPEGDVPETDNEPEA